VSLPRSAVGLDLQWSRTTVALLEGGPGQSAEMLVGDGHRAHIPNAVHGDLWATAAVEAAYRAGNGRLATVPDQVSGWRADPWSGAFLSSLARRLAGYLGDLPAIARNGYPGYLVGWLDVPANAADRLAAAGLPGIETVHPADAVLCRRLTDGCLPGPGADVAVVAVGERATAVAAYRLDWAPDGSIQRARRTAARSLAAGSGPWTDALAGSMLQHIPEPPTPGMILSFLDAVREASGIGAGRASWSGPLSERLPASHRVSWEAAALREAAQAGIDDVRMALDSVAPGRVPVLIGGPGATWAPLRAALAAQGRQVRYSLDPLTDLARGAARWPTLRNAFTASPG
jgi:hypothetical protein